MVMDVLKSPVFIISCIIFALHQLLQKGLEIPLPLIDDYLDNLLAMPIILTFLLVERRMLFKKGSDYRLPLLDVVMATLYISMITEVIFPWLSDKFTADWLDLVFYAIGSLIYFLTINRFPSKNKAPSSSNAKD
jgi:hypothetical protein